MSEINTLNFIKSTNIYNDEKNLKKKEYIVKHIKIFKKSLIKYNISLKTFKERLKKKYFYKKLKNKDIYLDSNYKFKKHKFKKNKTLKNKKYFNSKLSLKQYKNNFYAIFAIRNTMKRYYSTGLFFKSGPKKSSTYAAQLVGKLIGRYIKKILNKYKFRLKLKNICLNLKTKRNAFIYACLKGIYQSRIWFGVLDPHRKNPHGYVRLRKPRSL